MIHGISHELRTPVARLRFALEMVADAETPFDREQYINGMDHDIEELDKLVDEILTYANLEQRDAMNHLFLNTQQPLDMAGHAIKCQRQMTNGV
jgi:two-component system sensor histidine kinase RstB